jgi:hypothetical protein
MYAGALAKTADKQERLEESTTRTPQGRDNVRLPP